jgi:hypothetical protein
VTVHNTAAEAGDDGTTSTTGAETNTAIESTTTTTLSLSDSRPVSRPPIRPDWPVPMWRETTDG